MKKISEELESLFNAFESDRAIDLESFREELSRLALAYEEAAAGSLKIQTENEAFLNENAYFRKALAADCRAMLVLLGDSESDQKARSIESSPAGELLNLRNEIIKKYDSRFSGRSTFESGDGQECSHSRDQSHIAGDIMAFQTQ